MHNAKILLPAALLLLLGIVPTMASITIYKDSNFRGRRRSFNSAISNLKNYGLNDQASSMKISRGDHWLLYKDANFQGQVSVKSGGTYASPNSMGLPNDSLSSMRKIPRDRGAFIILFKDSNFRGRMVVLRGNNSNLKGIEFNDVVSSIIVWRGTWTVYKDKYFKGTSWRLRPGRYANPRAFQNDAISSVKRT